MPETGADTPLPNSVPVQARALDASSHEGSDDLTLLRRWRKRVIVVSSIGALIGAALVLPPLINIGRYQSRVTALMSRSMGRPVRLSSVGLRLLPTPGFVLHDLTVSEDPAFGAEPVLTARTVIASVGIFSLWRDRLEITRVSVDDASLNLVRTPQGQWNLESLMMHAQPTLTQAQPGGQSGKRPAYHFPYLEATNSRVNLKHGVEKSPFSIVNTDLSLWQDNPGEWRVRLRGQPVRTDLEMIWADTGEIRLEGSLHTAPQLRDMPLKIQAEWRDAQLGQLSRLLLGSDAGWRGDLTADLDVQGTADAARSKARLRVTGVRREEFTPDVAMDLDANCGFFYQRSLGAARDVDCDTGIGSGHLHLVGNLPGNGGEPEAMLEVKEVPLQAALDGIRTIRAGFAPGMIARGTANGSLSYKVVAPAQSSIQPHASGRSAKSATPPVKSPAPMSLQGMLTITGGLLRGGELKEPLTLPTMTWAPVLISDAATMMSEPARNLAVPATRDRKLAAAASEPPVLRLESRFTVQLGPSTPQSTVPGNPSSQTGKTPAQRAVAQPEARPLANGRQATVSHAETAKLAGQDIGEQVASIASITTARAVAVRLDIGARGYRAAISGSATISRIRDLAYAFGLPHQSAADSLSAGTADFDLSSSGPWIASMAAFAAPAASDQALPAKPTAPLSTDVPIGGVHPDQRGDLFAGSLHLHHAQWVASYLSRPVELPQGTIQFGLDSIHLSADFAYGPAKDSLKGSVLYTLLPACKSSECQQPLQLRFGALEASQVQAALLQPAEGKSILAPLMDRIRSGDRFMPPAIPIEVEADSLALGPAVLRKPVLQMHMADNAVVLEKWEAALLGGSASGTGRCSWADGKPHYSLEGSFDHLSPAALGTLLDTRWTGSSLDGTGKIELSGANEKELAASASGGMQFQWTSGTLNETTTAPVQPVRFDAWSGEVTIQGGKVQLGKNTLLVGKRSISVAGVLPFGGPARITVNADSEPLSAQTGHGPANPVSSTQKP